jgi:hypothetical protein
MTALATILLWVVSIFVYWRLVRGVGDRHWPFVIYTMLFVTPTIAYYKILGPMGVYPLWIGLPMYLEPPLDFGAIAWGIIAPATVTVVVAMSIRLTGRA